MNETFPESKNPSPGCDSMQGQNNPDFHALGSLPQLLTESTACKPRERLLNYHCISALWFKATLPHTSQPSLSARLSQT